ncbi:MAG TPA: hypothetical protein VMF52_12030 [Steroidobacteraceae bacterium]|nr:hypothetical protein [Steroidobacteraceae bacterium]
MSPAKIPRTLSAIAGLSTRPSRAEDSVLLLIDGQLEYTIGRLPLAGIDAAVEEGARLLAYARDRGIPVIHAIHHARRGAPVFDSSRPAAPARCRLRARRRGTCGDTGGVVRPLFRGGSGHCRLVGE